MHVLSPLCAVAGLLAGGPDDAQLPAFTYAKHVAPIVFRRCVTCHRNGEVAPFALTSYEETVDWAETIREVVDSRRMPPWFASPDHGKFSNDARLTDDERAAILKWIDGGMPEGDRNDLPPLPKFVDGWRISQPDVVLQMPKPFQVPATGTVNYKYFTIDPGFTEDRWVSAAEARPGNRAVVHHIVLLVEAPGDRPVRETGGLGAELLATFAPGLPPTEYADGMAKLIPAGSKLILQMHYTPNGTEQVDQSQIGLVLADPQTVRKRVRGAFALNFMFRIPPGASEHRVEAQYKFPQDSMIVSLFPHMHLRGKSFRFDAQFPDGTKETLLDVPRWDFNWQNQYVLAEPKPAPEGTLLRCTAHFDNSADNPANPNPNVPVTFGEQTWEEMMVGYFDIALVDQDLTLGGPQVTKVKENEFDVRFHYTPKTPANAVYLAGSFNEWKPTAHAMDGPDDKGRFSTRLTLPPGKHEYKFVVDGTTWKHDPGNPRQAGNYNNSVLTIAGELPEIPNCTPIDIQPQANQQLNKDFGPASDGNNLESLPTGDRRLLGVPVRIGPGMIALGSRIKTERPLRVDGIRVDMQFEKLHLVHATEFGTGEPGSDNHVADGTTIGEYTVHYANGETAKIPIVYGADVRDWWYSGSSKDVTHGKIAWQGVNELSRQAGAGVRLYLTTWQNPKPRERVTRIDFSAAETAAAPFCVALTAQAANK